MVLLPSIALHMIYSYVGNTYLIQCRGSICECQHSSLRGTRGCRAVIHHFGVVEPEVFSGGRIKGQRGSADRRWYSINDQKEPVETLRNMLQGLVYQTPPLSREKALALKGASFSGNIFLTHIRMRKIYQKQKCLLANCAYRFTLDMLQSIMVLCNQKRRLIAIVFGKQNMNSEYQGKT